ncbi:MarR family transcriptional regulator [Actinomadura logoneensis]|uniref:MarR family transcriptional regulator n=1 Tax=Actinomadura logoneensis TaxID=2293572 RepID=A0A372JAJ8_9ACTN|nr:MarR family winged helix-turn-helix transcriptional regulator [Actinomadura logoneensis]RFU37017.1 MarR family transcriptional regulator [Actinomadura logoneensis]
MDRAARRTPPRMLGVTTYALARAGRLGRARMARMMGEHGLGLWHFAVLSALDDTVEPPSQRDLGARLGIDPSDLVDVVGSLAERGLLRRDRDPSDRRRYVVALTAEGRTELEAVTGRAADLDGELLAALDPSERAVFADMLRRVLDHQEDLAARGDGPNRGDGQGHDRGDGPA